MVRSLLCFIRGKESRASQVRKTLTDLLALTKPWLPSSVFNLVFFRAGDFETLDSIFCSSLCPPPSILSTFPFLWHKLSPRSHALHLGICLNHCQVKGEAPVLGDDELLCSQYSSSAFLLWSCCCLCLSWQCSSSDDCSLFRPVAPPCPKGFSQLPVNAKSVVGSDEVPTMLAYLLTFFNKVSCLFTHLGLSPKSFHLGMINDGENDFSSEQFHGPTGQTHKG